MNKQNQILADYVYLAEASYTDFSRSDDAYNELKDKTNGKQPESFAKLVTDNYKVVAHYKDRIATPTDEFLSAESKRRVGACTHAVGHDKQCSHFSGSLKHSDD